MIKMQRSVIALIAGWLVLMLSFSSMAYGVLTFYDDFSGVTLDNWTVLSGTWSIVGGELCQSVVDNSYVRGRIAVKDFTCKDLSVEADVKFVELYPNGWAYAGFAVRYLDENTFYWTVLKQTADENGLPNSNLKLELRSKFNYLVVKDLGFVGELSTFYKLKTVVEGDSFKIYVNDVLEIEYLDSTFGNAGSVLMWTGRCKANFDNVLVLDPEPMNVVPEPAPFIISALCIAALSTYALIRRRPIKRFA
jgi:hypothetical protein